MRKIIAFAISLIMMLSGSMVPVFADQQNAITNVVITPNAANNQVVVKGNISTGNGKNVTIQVLDANGYLDYLGQTTSTEGGEFTFTFKSNSGTKGTYTVKIGGEGISTPCEKTFEFSGAVVTPSQISNLTVKADKDTSQVTVEGDISTGTGKNVTLQVLDPNGILDYIGQTISIEGGKFTFSFTATKVLKGTYTVKIGGEGISTPYEKNFEFSGEVITSAEISNVKVNADTTTSQITVEGNISTGSGRNVTIQVLNPNGDVDYIGQTISTEGGKFTFTFTATSVLKGSYTVKIGGEGIQIPYEKTFEFTGNVVTPTEISNVTVNAIAATSKVTVEGNISTGSEKNVTIKVLDPNGDVEYIGQTTSTEGGKFTFIFTTNSVLKGSYTVKIGGQGVQTPYEKSFEFTGTVVTPAQISNVAIKADKATAGVTVEGNISTGSGKNVTIKVLDPNGDVEYIGQSTSTEGGKFTFAFTSNSVLKGSYTVKIGGEGISIPYEKSFEFPGDVVTPTQISNIAIKADKATAAVTVEGNISTGSGKNVTIKVLDPNGEIEYIGQIISTEGGKFKFTFKVNAVVEGSYTVNLGGEGISVPYQQNFEFSGGSQEQKPLAPTDLKVVAGTSQVNLTWSASIGATGYYVYRATTANGNYTKLNSDLVTTTSYSDTGLIENTTYYYKVTAVNAVGESDMSSSVTATTGAVIVNPAVISNIEISADITTGNVVVTGNISTGSGKNVTIMVLAPNKSQDYIGQVVSTEGGKFVFKFRTNNVLEGDYTVKVGGEGILIPYQQTFQFSNSSTDQKPSAPTDLKASAAGTNEIDLTWTAVTGVTGYNVYRSATADGEYTKVNNSLVTTTSYNDTDLSAKTAYYYKVTAVNTIGESDKGASVTATTGSDGGSSSSDESSSTSATATSKRLAGLNRMDTSIAIAKEQFSSKQPDAIVLTSGEDFPDALGGSGLAYKQNAPVLLVGKSVSDSKNVLDYINANLAKNKNIYVLGGTGAVSTEVSDYLTAQGYNVVRLGGIDRYETNQKIVDSLNVAKGTPIVIANGNYFADALSISSIADMKGYPVLINGQDSLSANVIKDITNIQPTTVYVIGGTGVLSASIETQIKNLNANTNIVRLGGKDRYETSLMIADKFNLSTNTITVASGENFPDALSGSVLAARKNSNVLLINNSDVSKQKELLKKQNITNVIVLGGEGVVNKGTVDSLIQK